MASFTARMIGAARLDGAIFEEVEADRDATPQAMTVVALASLAAGLGTGAGLSGFVLGTVLAVVSWFIWAYLTYWIGTRLLPEPGTRTNHGELLRVIGFASAPGLLRVAGVLPGLRGLVFVVTGVWMLVATVVAVRHALDYQSTWRAAGVCLIGWLVQALVAAILVVALGGRDTGG